MMTNYWEGDLSIEEFYGGDPREIPIYGLQEVSRYLKVNRQTLVTWVKGRKYRIKDGTKKYWKPVIDIKETKPVQLSFYNLIEIHVLLSIRRIHNIPFSKVRTSLNYLTTKKELHHPLATEQFWTDDFELFVKEAGELICVSNSAQYVLQEVVKQYLKRIDRDPKNLPCRIYPFPTEISIGRNIQGDLKELSSQPKSIVIDPLISFGNPTISGTGVPTNIIAGRFIAGEKIGDLSDDYGIEKEKIKEALQFEGLLRRAA